MKSKIARLMGVALILVLMVSMVAGTGLVSAGDAKWTSSGFPTTSPTGVGYFTSSGTNSVIGMDKDGALWIYNGTNLLKSANEGRTWTKMAGYTGAAVEDFVFSKTDAKVFYVLGGDIIYKTVDGGTTFVAFAATNNGVVNAFDVTAFAGTTYVFAATDAGVEYAAEVAGSTGYGGSASVTWAAVGALATKVLDIAASPNFATDAVLIAVYNNATGTAITYNKNAGVWGATLLERQLTATPATSAQMDLVDNFSTTVADNRLEAYVAVNDGAGAEGALFKVVLSGAYAVSTGDFTSVDVKGNVGAITGIAAGATIVNSDANGVTWTPAIREFGSNAYVKLGSAAGKAYAVTSGANGGFATQVAAGIYNQISLMNLGTPAIAKLIMAGTDRYALVTGPATDALMRYDGTNWDRISAADADLIAVSGTIVYYTLGTEIYQAGSKGNAAFTKLYTDAPFAVTALLPIDPANIIIGFASGIAYTLDGGYTWPVSTSTINGNVANFAVSPAYATDSTIIGGTSTGYVYKSTNKGVTWTGAVVETGATNALVAFDPAFATSKAYYAAATTAAVTEVYKYGTSWKSIYTGTGTNPTGIAVGADGTLYVADSLGGILRCLDTTVTTPVFEAVTSGLATTPEVLSNLSVATAAGKNTVTGVNAAKLWQFTDVMAVEVANVKIAQSLQQSVTVTWDAVPSATSYKVSYSQREDLVGLVEATPVLGTDLTTFTITGLTAGTKYWVKVQAIAPMLSKESKVLAVNTNLLVNEWSPMDNVAGVAPAMGATDVPLKPTFRWNAAQGAIEYEFVLADNPTFATPLENKKVTTTVYTTTATLKNATNYYWKVTAIKSDSRSQTGMASFTTVPAATVGPTTPPVTVVMPTPIVTVNVPTQPAQPTPIVTVNIPTQPAQPTPIITNVVPEPKPQATPAYVWAIIAIGAVLVIAVLVLIIRTRRPV